MIPRRSIQAAIATMGLLVAPAAWADAPPNGVYSCYDVRMGFSTTGIGNMVITPTPFAMFGLIDGATYSDWDGHHGHYSYDAAGGIITMTDGSRQGWRYRKTANWSFTLIDNKTGRTIYTCPLETAKNPSHGPW